MWNFLYQIIIIGHIFSITYYTKLYIQSHLTISRFVLKQTAQKMLQNILPYFWKQLFVVVHKLWNIVKWAMLCWLQTCSHKDFCYLYMQQWIGRYVNFSSSNSSSNYLVMSHEEPSAVGPEKASTVTFNFEKMEKTPLQQQRFHILRYLARKFYILVLFYPKY